MPDYATVAEARARGINTTSVPLDSELSTWLEEASREVDNYTHTRFGVTAPTTKTFYSPGSFILLPYPFSGITSVTVDGVVQAATAYTLEQFGIRFGWRPSSPVSVTAIFGYPNIPSPVLAATVLFVQANLEDGTYRPSIGTDTEGNASGLPIVGTVPFTSRTKRAVAREKLDPYRVLEGVA